MKIEFKILIYSMVNNLAIALIKIISGITLGLGSLIADGLHTGSDFITDIICIIGAKISKKKPTKYHPFGFGKTEYLINLLIGIILFSLGLYIIISSFGSDPIKPPTYILWILAGTIVLKLVAIIIMNIIGKKINSQVLITSVEESKSDLVSSIGVALIAIILQFSDKYPILKYSDMIGSIIIGIYIIKTSLKILINNSLLLIGEVDNNEEAIDKIKNYLLEYKNIEDQKITLIKYGSYYQLQLLLDVDSKLSLRQVTNLEKKIKTGILKHRSLNVKNVNIYVTNKIE